MHLPRFFLPIAFLSLPLTHAALNDPCGSNKTTGICLKTSSCAAGGGTTINGACPDDDASIKCCSKASCGNGGTCQFTAACAGTSQSGLCPGPDDFKCCIGGGGGFPAPEIPSVGACRKVAVEGAKAVVAANGAQVREIGCVREGCACGGDGSDHCCGLAVDLMCSEKAGVKTDAGEAIAEWVMDHRESLDLKYVIWGQRIWNPSRDGVKPWGEWRKMEDRGSVTANHWDHVHCSFNG